MKYCAPCGTPSPRLLTISKKRGNGDDGRSRHVWLPVCADCASSLVAAAGDRARINGFSVRGMRKSLSARQPAEATS